MRVASKLLCWALGHRYVPVVTSDIGAWWAADRCRRCGFETIGTLLADVGAG